MDTTPRPTNEFPPKSGEAARQVAALRHRPRLKLALMAAAALALPLMMPAPSASAGDVQWSVRIGSSDHSRGGHHNRGRHGGGYTKQVWCPPVYRTRYDDCGRPVRVCVQTGYYKTVYVQASYQPTVHRRSYRDTSDRRYSGGYSRDYSRSSSRDYFRRGQWGNRGSSCGY